MKTQSLLPVEFETIKALLVLLPKIWKKKIKQVYIDEYHFTNLFIALEKRGRGLPFPAIKFFIATLPKLVLTSRTFRRRILNKVFQLVCSRLRV